MTDRRQSVKFLRQCKKAARRERLKRDKVITEKYGIQGHGQCGRKTRYSSELHAESRAASLGARYGVDLRVYHCDLCGGWHLTKACNYVCQGV